MVLWAALSCGHGQARRQGVLSRPSLKAARCLGSRWFVAVLPGPGWFSRGTDRLCVFPSGPCALLRGRSHKDQRFPFLHLATCRAPCSPSSRAVPTSVMVAAHSVPSRPAWSLALHSGSACARHPGAEDSMAGQLPLRVPAPAGGLPGTKSVLCSRARQPAPLWSSGFPFLSLSSFGDTRVFPLSQSLAMRMPSCKQCGDTRGSFMSCERVCVSMGTQMVCVCTCVRARMCGGEGRWGEVAAPAQSPPLTAALQHEGSDPWLRLDTTTWGLTSWRGAQLFIPEP